VSLQPDIAMNVDRDELSAAEIARAVAGRKMSALSVTDAALARIAKRDPVLNSFTDVAADRAIGGTNPVLRLCVIDHLAIDRDGTLSVTLGFLECCDGAMRIGDLVVGRNEGVAGDLDLAGMDDLLAINIVHDRCIGRLSPESSFGHRSISSNPSHSLHNFGGADQPGLPRLSLIDGSNLLRSSGWAGDGCWRRDGNRAI